MFNREKWGLKTTCKWKVNFFCYFPMTRLPEHHVYSCGSRQTQKIQVLLKTKASLIVMKGMILFFLLVVGLFFRMCWPPYPDQNSWCDPTTCFCGCRFRVLISSLQDENWACNDFLIHGEYHIIQDGRPMWSPKKEKKIFLCFQKIPNGWQVVSIQETDRTKFN